MSESRRVLLVTPNFENNSLGRTYCLWLLCRELGWPARVVGVKGTGIWEPLAGSEMAADCRVPAPGTTRADIVRGLRADVEWSDVVISVKVLGTSLGVALDLVRGVPRPLVADIDDPDVEVRTTWRPWRERLPRLVLSGRHRARERELRALKRTVADLPRIVSNPVLQRMYGGVIIPHVRQPEPQGPAGTSTAPIVRFVGSPRAAKGVDTLREAVARLADKGYRLGITATPPADARPWEEWYGTTSLAEGRRLVATADIVALPSTTGGYSRAQLPAKLMDAMIQGRAVVATDLEPIRWALDDPSLLVEPGSVDSLTRALLALRDPAVRDEIGHRLRDRAIEHFTVQANAPIFESVVVGAADRFLSSDRS